MPLFPYLKSKIGTGTYPYGNGSTASAYSIFQRKMLTA
jgi:hypothetical protein